MVYYIDIALSRAVLSKYNANIHQRIVHHLELAASVGITHTLRVPVILNIVEIDNRPDCALARVIKTDCPDFVVKRGGFALVEQMVAITIEGCTGGEAAQKERSGS